MKIHTMNRPFQGKKGQKGYTLIEIAVGVALVLGILGSLAYYFVTADSRLASKDVIQGLTDIALANKQTFKGNYTGLNNAIVIQSGKVPPGLTLGSGATATLGTQWGAVTVAATNFSGGTNNAQSFTIESLPRDVCNAVISGAEGNFKRITADGTVVKDLSAATPVTTTGSAVISACDGEAVDVVFIGT